MYLICVSYFTGPEINFFGPFPTLERAVEYGRELERCDASVRRFFAARIIVPYSVVEDVKWRKNEINLSA